MHDGDIGHIFHPRSIAIVGASAAPFSSTSIFFLYPLLDFGYPGKIYPVNPNSSEILGLKAYARLKDIPENIDYVICALPAAGVAGLLQECIDLGVKLVTVFTAGFGETGTEEGARMEAEILDIARRGGIRLIGPNCLGLHCPAAGISLEPGISRDSGHLSCLSQSGGNAKDLVLAMNDRHIYLNKAVSFGNAIDLNETDYLSHFAGDDDTHIIAAYIEGIKEPRRFASVLKEAAARKPVIILKGGNTAAGVEAVASHTGALAGSKSTWDALVRQTGAVQVRNLEELIDTLAVFSHLKPVRGRRLGVVGMGGGANVISADECENAGFVLPAFPESMKRELWEFTNFVGTGLRNPIDTTADVYFSPELLNRTIRVVGAWDGVDALFVCLPALVSWKVGPDLLNGEIDAITDAAGSLNKPVLVILRTVGLAQGEIITSQVQGKFFEAGLPLFRSFEQATRALDKFVAYHEGHAR